MMDSYIRADAERLGEQVWTDEQVQDYLAALDAKLAAGAINLDFEFIMQAGRFEWMEYEYRLTDQGKKIRLLHAQAQTVADWVQAHKPQEEIQPMHWPYGCVPTGYGPIDELIQESRIRVERDTHFMGFARLLWNELFTVEKGNIIDVSQIDSEEIHTRYQQLIARRAYDLACHVAKELSPYDMPYEVDKHTIEGILASIPDMTAWPDII